MRVVTTVLVAFAFVVLAAPVSAAQLQYDYFGAQALCRYTSTSSAPDGTWTNALLTKIVVKPPQLMARNHRKQKVGWFAVVRRYDNGFGGYSQEIYHGNLRTAIATPSLAASFSPVRLDVTVPSDSPDQTQVYYSVNIQIRYFRADGSDGYAAGQWFYDFATYVDNVYVGDWNAEQPVNYCSGLIQQDAS